MGHIRVNPLPPQAVPIELIHIRFELLNQWGKGIRIEFTREDIAFNTLSNILLREEEWPRLKVF
jgi:hypothetical protein